MNLYAQSLRSCRVVAGGVGGRLVNSTTDGIDASPGDGICGTLAGTCTLRAAVMESNELAGQDTITFGIIGTFTLTLPGADDAALTGDLDITGDVMIAGSRPSQTVVDGGGLDRAFHVDPLSTGIRVRIAGLTVRGGTTTGEGGGILNTGKADLDLSKVVITSNKAARGGGLSNASNFAKATVRDVVLRANNATSHVGGLANQGTIALTDVTVEANTATGDVGGMSAGGVAILDRVTINGNTAHGIGQGGSMIGGLSVGDGRRLSTALSVRTAAASAGSGTVADPS